jgi:hypothetical protein
MALTAKTRAWGAVLGGLLLTAAGAGLIYLPAGLILAGVALAAVGLFALDVDEKDGNA